MKTFATICAQGDVLFRAVDAIPGDAVPVAAMGRGDVIPLFQRGADARRDAFLPQIGVEIPPDQPLTVQLDPFGFENADLVSCAEKFFQKFARRRVLQRSSSTHLSSQSPIDSA